MASDQVYLDKWHLEHDLENSDNSWDLLITNSVMTW